MPFGRYKGRPLDELPDSYIDWLMAEADIQSDSLRAALKSEHNRRLNARDKSKHLMDVLADCPSVELAKEIVEKGYRSVSKTAHPDAGGSHDRMIMLQETREWMAYLLRLLPEGDR